MSTIDKEAYLKKKLVGDIPMQIARRIYLLNGTWRKLRYFTNIETGEEKVSAPLFLFARECGSFPYGVAGQSKVSKVTDIKRFRHFVCMPMRFGKLSDEQLKAMIVDIVKFGTENRESLIFVYPKSLLDNWVTPENKKKWIITTSRPQSDFDWENRASINAELEAIGSPLRLIADSDKIPVKFNVQIKKKE